VTWLKRSEKHSSRGCAHSSPHYGRHYLIVNRGHCVMQSRRQCQPDRFGLELLGLPTIRYRCLLSHLALRSSENYQISDVRETWALGGVTSASPPIVRARSRPASCRSERGRARRAHRRYRLLCRGNNKRTREIRRAVSLVCQTYFPEPDFFTNCDFDSKKNEALR